jgi:hypothetical protein
VATFPSIDEDYGLEPTLEVLEEEEPEVSKLLDQWGDPIPYQSKKLGHIGFIKLKETT